MTKPRARILFVAHTTRIGGATNSLFLLVRHLKNQYDVAVLVPEEGILCEWLATEGVPYFVLPGLRANTLLQVFRLIRRERFDLVYGNNPSRRARNVMLAAKMARVPFIWHFRGVMWGLDWRLGLFVRFADAVVAVSQATAESLNRFYPSQKIHVVYNGLELKSFTIDRAMARCYIAEQIHLPPDAHYVLSVAHLVPRKGHEHGVAVMAELTSKVPDVHLMVAGRLDNTEYAQKVRATIREYGLEDKVHLLGLRTDIPWLLGGADVLLHTATQEAFGRVLIEAMAAGLPVVAFAVDGVHEIIVPGKTGYLVPPGDVAGMADALRSLLIAPDKAVEMGHLGRERVENLFRADRTAAQIAQIIESLL